MAAITLAASRGRGSYRAVLAERLRLAREHGATLALVKGRILTYRADPAPSRVRRLRRGALLLAPD